MSNSMTDSLHQSARLVGDIGGTNARFAVLDEHDVPVKTASLQVDSVDGLSAAIDTYAREQGIESFARAAIAVATPITSDIVSMTNSDWSFSIRETQKHHQLSDLHVVNDFTALALSVPRLPADQLVQVGGGVGKDGHAIGVIGPGTGLGVSGLVRAGEGWTALQGEGGHVTVGVTTARERAVRDLLARSFSHVSAERFLSGPGLVNIAASLRQIDGLEARNQAPADITRLGVAGDDPVCAETLAIFCRLLGSCAGNLALTLGAEGGIYIGGGIVPRLGRYFEESDFREVFEAKGRMQGYLKHVPTIVIHSPYPALFGVASLLS